MQQSHNAARVNDKGAKSFKQIFEEAAANDDDPLLDFEHEEAFHHWFYDELAKSERGEEAQVRRDGFLDYRGRKNPKFTLLVPQWVPPKAAAKGNGSEQLDIQITVFDKSDGPLTKEISLAKDGTVVSDGSACKMSRGEARRITVGGVEEFAEIIARLRPFQGIALGTLREGLADEVEIVAKAKLNRDKGAIARTRENFVYREGKPALVPIDFDRNGIPDTVQEHIGDDVWRALTTALPDLGGVARVMRRSTSAGLYNGGAALPTSGGWHGYVLVADGSDSERFLKMLHERCWMAGMGWFLISKDGKLLERSIVDRSVATPEHLLFEGPPIVKPPLKQDAEERRPIAYAGGILDTRVACPELTAAEQKTVDALKEQLRAQVQPEADKVRVAYVEERVEELVQRTGMSKADAMKVAESQCAGVLSEHVVLEFSDRKFKGCTVGDVLSEPERFARASLADPIEGPNYKSGRTTAMIMLRRDNGYPWIRSYAHGGERSFTLVRNPGDELKLGFPGRIPDYAQKKPGTALQTPVGSVVVPDWRERNRYAGPVPSMHNAGLAIEALGVVCSYDTFHNKMLFGYREDVAPPGMLSVMLGEVTDNGIIRLRKIISDSFGIDMKDAATRDAVVALALDHCFDPVRDMLDQAEAAYDGVKRLDRMAVEYFNCADTPLNRAIVRKTMIAAVRRVRQPGCKFDNITVMESDEGWNKSTAWRVLAGDENFSDASILGHGAREIQEQLSEVWIHENAELAGMKKAEIETVKSFASRQSDDARPAYGHFLKKQKRHSIEVGTTNSDEYLQSQTGNRRFWPLKLLAPLNIEMLKRDRLQLWGEAATYEAAGESIVLDKKLWPAAAAEQEKRRMKDPWEDVLENIPTHTDRYYPSNEIHFFFLKKGENAEGYDQIRHLSRDKSLELVASADLLKNVLGVQLQQQTNVHSTRLAATMKRFGWKAGRFYIDDKQVRGYSRPITAAAARDYEWVVEEKPKSKSIVVTPIGEASESQKRRQRYGRFHIIGPGPDDAICCHCRKTDDVMMVCDTRQPGSDAMPLHERCASAWFA